MHRTEVGSTWSPRPTQCWPGVALGLRKLVDKTFPKTIVSPQITRGLFQVVELEMNTNFFFSVSYKLFNLPGSRLWDFPGKNIRVDWHFLLQGNLPDPRIELASAGGFLTTEPPGKPAYKLVSTGVFCIENYFRTFLVAQWIIHLPMQGTWVWSLIREDSTCWGASKPMHHN